MALQLQIHILCLRPFSATDEGRHVVSPCNLTAQNLTTAQAIVSCLSHSMEPVALLCRCRSVLESESCIMCIIGLQGLHLSPKPSEELQKDH